MPTKIDFKKQLKHLYNPSSKQVTVVDVPELNFLMIDGEGDPNTSEAYQDAIETLFAVSYALKFAIKRGESGIDFAVMPLEGLWWVEDMTQFSMENRDAWKWTAMIMQPAYVTQQLVEGAVKQVEKKKGLASLSDMRFAAFPEGTAAQIMYFGPYSEEAPTIDKIHGFIRDQGYRLRGKHHEIYLSDPRRTAPHKLKTIIRQPFE
ncbi:MAG: GyrI-like domain-containing protein [Deltaproteobacteria bacterium]|nr:GyrI-like domain-containing protein [Deltaproteobacteria bacterium]MBW2341582.1 GyrI-like domain-containing protein [Deltaproteobacteria bacterium]